MDDSDYHQIIQGWKYQSTNLNDCLVFSTYNIFLDLSRKTAIKKLKLSLGKIKEYTNYDQLRGTSKADLCPKINQIIEPMRFRAVEKNRADGITIDDLIEIVQDADTSYPAIHVRWEYFKEQNARYDHQGRLEYDHVIIVLDIDIDRQVMTIFDPMEKFIERSTNVKKLNREVSLPKMSTHWARARSEPNWIFFVEKIKTGQTRLEVEYT